MEHSWIGRTALVVMSALWLGCGTPCERARTRMEGRYAECGIEITKLEDAPENEVCSDGEGEYQKCVADCTDSVSCEALKGEDLMGSADFGECLADCAN